MTASHTQPALIPLELWKRVQVEASFPPFMAWSLDDHLRAGHREQLIRELNPSAELIAAAQPPAMAQASLNGFGGQAAPAEDHVAARRCSRSRDLPQSAIDSLLAAPD